MIAEQSAAVTRIFVSYSRKDLAFVDRLATALEAHQIATTIDRTEIYAFEAWWTRIESLIAAADTIVFVLSPDSLASDICRKEVEHARALNKRLAPIVCRPVAGEADKIPPELAQLNFIFFDDFEGFDAALNRLAAALRTDLAWTRQHTQLGLEAAEWRKAAGSKGLLLRSPRLEDAERWIAARPADALAPSDEILAFVLSSRQAATRRRNLLSGSLAAGLAIAVVLAAVALWQRGQAVEQRATAERQTVVAKRNAAEAERQTGLAKAAATRAEAAAKAERDAREANLREQSVTLAGVSQRLLEEGRSDLAQAVALEGLPQAFDPLDRPFVGRAAQAFKSAAESNRLYAAWTVSKGRNPLSAVFSKDQRNLIVGTNAGELLIYDVAERRLAHVIQTTDDVLKSLALSPDGSRVAATGGHDAFVVDIVSGKLLFTLPGNPRKFLKTIAYTQDGKLILAGGADNTISAWEAASGKLVRKVTGTDFEPGFDRYLERTTKAARDPIIVALAQATFRMGGATTLIANQPGSLLVAATGDSDPEAAVRLFNLEDGLAGKVLLGHAYDSGLIPKINAIAFSPDGKSLVSGADDGTARLWDVASGDAVKVLECASPVLDARFSPDGSLLATASQDASVRLWSVAKGKQVAQLFGHQRAVEDLAFSPDGEMIATASDDNTARLWSARTGVPLASFPADGVVHQVAFSPDGKLVATVSRDGLVRLWRTSTDGDFLLRYPPVSKNDYIALNEKVGVDLDPAVYLGFSRDGGRVVAAGGDFKKVALWDVVGRHYIGAVEGTRFVHRALGSNAISVMQSPLAGETPILEETAAQRSWTLPRPVDDRWISDFDWIVRGDGTRSIGARGWLFEPDAPRQGNVNGLVLFDVPAHRALATLVVDGWLAEKPRFSRDGKIIVAPIVVGGIEDRKQKLAAWNAETGALISVSSAPQETFTLLDMSNSGRFVITAEGGYANVKMFDTTRKWMTWTISGSEAINAIAISSGGAFVATGSQAGRIEVTDTRSFTRVASVQTGLKPIVKLAFSDDDRLLASVDGAGLVSVFDRASGDRLAKEVLPGSLVAVRFSPQSDRLVALLSDGSLYVMSDGFGDWALRDPRDMVAWGWGSLSTNLNAVERRRIGLDETGGRFHLALAPGAVPAPITLPPLAHAKRSAKAGQCDVMAGDSLDRGRAVNVPERPIADAGKALRACADALSESPGDLLLRYEQARAMAAGGNKSDAYAVFRDTAAAGHAAAMWSVADLIDKHEAPPSQSETASSWYERAEQAGDPRALDRKSRLLAQAARSDDDLREALRYALAIAPARPASYAFAIGAEIAAAHEVPDWRARALRIYEIAIALRQADATPLATKEEALFSGFVEQLANLARATAPEDIVRLRKAALLFVAGGNHPW